MRILIAGLGAIGQRHARNLRQLCGGRLELLAFRIEDQRHFIRPVSQVKSAIF